MHRTAPRWTTGGRLRRSAISTKASPPGRCAAWATCSKVSMRPVWAVLCLSVLTCSGADTLRSAAEARGIAVGTAVASRLLAQPQYAEVLAREFNQVQAENEMKMRAIHPARDRYDFSGADAIVAFAAAHGMKVRGHTLVWHESVPA